MRLQDECASAGCARTAQTCEMVCKERPAPQPKESPQSFGGGETASRPGRLDVGGTGGWPGGSRSPLRGSDYSGVVYSLLCAPLLLELSSLSRRSAKESRGSAIAAALVRHTSLILRLRSLLDTQVSSWLCRRIVHPACRTSYTTSTNARCRRNRLECTCKLPATARCKGRSR